jgi:hypothetical protein
MPDRTPRGLLFDARTVQCPYCFEMVELDLDPDTEGTFVQDCEVCCHPWTVRVSFDEEGEAVIDVQRE